MRCIVVVCCLLLLSSCEVPVALAPINGEAVGFSMQLASDTSVTVHIPPPWKAVPDPVKNKLLIKGPSPEEKIVITVKHLNIDTVDMPMLRVFGHIYLKDEFTSDWGKDLRPIEGIRFAGHQAIGYQLHRGKDASYIYFVARDSSVCIVEYFAPNTRIDTVADLFRHKITFSSQAADDSYNKPITSQSKVAVAAAIRNLDITGLDEAIAILRKNQFRTLPVSKQAALLEQLWVKYALFKSEGLFFPRDVFFSRIREYSKSLYGNHRSLASLARCSALIDYLDNALEAATASLRNHLQHDGEDFQAKLYLAMIRPYDIDYGASALLFLSGQRSENILALFLQARYWRATGNTRRSMDAITKACDTHPHNLWLSFTVAGNYLNQGKNAKAASIYSSTILTNPRFSPARYQLAFLLYKQKKYDAALKQLDALLATDIGDTRALLLKGLLNGRLGHHKVAKQAFEQVLTIDPDNFRALYNLGALCASKLQDRACARLAFARYLKTAPDVNRNESIAKWLKKN